MEQAEWLDALCRRYGALPSQILAEDAQILEMMAIIDRAGGGDDLG